MISSKESNSKGKSRSKLLPCLCMLVISTSSTVFGSSLNLTAPNSPSSSTYSTLFPSPSQASNISPYNHQQLPDLIRSSDNLINSSKTSNLGENKLLKKERILSSTVIPESIEATATLNVASNQGSTTSSSSVTSPSMTLVPASYSLPQPFDSSLNSAFLGTGCPSFFYTFLADPVFMSCAPFSLLLSTSQGFFNAERSPNSLLPHVLEASCSAPSTTCSNLMSKLAETITSSSACKDDLAAGNSLANQALTGFKNYDIMRQAGCLKDNSTSQFCFAEASSKSDRSSVYFYFLPIGTALPNTTTISCDLCTKGVLQIYSGYENNPDLLISKSYLSASTSAAAKCGKSFVVPFRPTQNTTSSTSSIQIGSLYLTISLIWILNIVIQ